jgi:hypothetical protein
LPAIDLAAAGLTQPPLYGAAVIRKVSSIDHVPITENCNSRIMASSSNMLTREEFASLLTVGSVSAVLDPLVAIPAEHSARLIGLGYMVDLAGKLRMTTHGRRRIAAAFDYIALETKLGQTRDGELLTQDRGAVPS